MRHAIGVFALIAVNGGYVAYQAASPAIAVITLAAASVAAFVTNRQAR